MLRNINLRILAVAAFFFATQGLALAQQDPRDVLRSLHFEQGHIPLGQNLATIDLRKNYRFLNNPDTQTFLTKFYGNPPGAGKDALGLIIPADVNPLGPQAWVAVVEYQALGFVNDSDAESVNYDDLLKQMQDATAAADKERVKQGYDKITLIGWAQKPYYDRQQKKLYWAKRLRFGNSPKETLNYEIRILGRTGVLDLNIVAAMNALPVINQRINSILAMVHFNPGNTYADYKPGVDKAAAYGIAGLIAGGVLAKAGFFKALLLLLAGAWKLVGAVVIGAFAALSAFFKNLFSRRSRNASALPPPTPDT